MTRRERDLKRLLHEVAEPYQAAVRVEHTGRHLRATFSIGACSRFIAIALTPSDHRFHRNVRRDARRALNQLPRALPPAPRVAAPLCPHARTGGAPPFAVTASTPRRADVLGMPYLERNRKWQR
jgi:hypothetical protein